MASNEKQGLHNVVCMQDMSQVQTLLAEMHSGSFSFRRSRKLWIFKIYGRVSACQQSCAELRHLSSAWASRRVPNRSSSTPKLCKGGVVPSERGPSRWSLMRPSPAREPSAAPAEYVTCRSCD